MYIWLYEYVCCMCGMMWNCKCVICMCMVILALCGYVMLWSQSDIHAWYDLVLWVCYDRMYADLGVLHDWNLYVVLNTTCSYIWCYVMWFGIYKVWLLWLYNAVMCVYVDNYVDNSLIYVDNFLLQMQHFYELFWKYYIFVYFRTLSLIISCLLLLSTFFIILL